MHTGSYVNGQWYHPQSSRKIRNINPADPNDVIAEFPAATAADAQRAIDAAQAAFRNWKNTPGPERGRVLWRAANLARQRADEIARVMTREEGKILKEAKGEVLKGISLLEFYSGEGYRVHGKTLPSEARDTFTYTIRRPLGVVGLIAPWNFPWAIPVWKSAPALVAGNTVVFKPAELTPATATLLAEIYEAAGLPAGVFNMVVGSGSQVGEPIVNSPLVRAVSFTGSNAVGSALYVKAANRGAKVTCEMGGKNAVIVMPDADLDKAAVAIQGGAFGSTGQRCTATSRVIAMPQVKDALVERIAAHAKKLKVGPGLDESVEMGPAVDEKQWQTDFDYIEVGKQEGARLARLRRSLPQRLPAFTCHMAGHRGREQGDPDGSPWPRHARHGPRLHTRHAGDAPVQRRSVRTGAGGGDGEQPGRGAQGRQLGRIRLDGRHLHPGH